MTFSPKGKLKVKLKRVSLFLKSLHSATRYLTGPFRLRTADYELPTGLILTEYVSLSEQACIQDVEKRGSTRPETLKQERSGRGWERRGTADTEQFDS